MPRDPSLGPGPFQARRATHPCAVSRIVLQDFSFFPTHLRLFRFPAECSCSSKNITLGAPSGPTGEHFPRILTPLGWGTRLAGGKATHSLSTPSDLTTRCGSTAMGIREANRCT